MRTSHASLARGFAALLFLLALIVAAPGFAQSRHQHAQAKPAAAPGVSRKSPAAEYTPTVRFRLRTELAEGKMAFVGAGGDIEGVVNPVLRVAVGDIVQVTLVNNDGIEHDVAFPDFKAATDRVNRKGASSVTVFRADKGGEFAYFCSLPGHRQAGMEGKINVGGAKAPVAALPPSVSITRAATDLPGPPASGAPRTVKVELEAVELVGKLASETTYAYWTFNGKVPGPFLRVRVGDTVELGFKNRADSRMIHSIDLHAVTGPGGGAVMTQTPPGESKTFRFKALNPGLYVYHCATPMVANHISSGMYGLILVEPPGGLPKVDHEFYVMQGEIYTDRPYGQRGHDEFSVEKLADSPGLRCVVEHDPMNRVIPHAVVYFTPDWAGPSGNAVQVALAKGEPHIYVQQGAHQGGYFDEIAVDPINLSPGEELIVAARLREELTRH